MLSATLVTKGSDLETGRGNGEAGSLADGGDTSDSAWDIEGTTCNARLGISCCTGCDTACTLCEHTSGGGEVNRGTRDRGGESGGSEAEESENGGELHFFDMWWRCLEDLSAVDLSKTCA